MKKLILIIVSILFTSLLTNAASSTTQARKTLDKAANKVALSKGASAQFTISGNSFGKQSGTIAVKGNKFNARTDKAIVWYDGKTQWLYNKKNDEVNISTPSATQQQTMNPYHVLSLYKKGYNMTLSNTANGYQVHLTAQSKNGRNIKEMYILIDKQYNLKQVKMKQKEQWITITVSALKQQQFSDNSFRFNAKDYPKAEIIDLR